MKTKSNLLYLTLGITLLAAPEICTYATGNPPAEPGQLLISEFRLRGPGGATDEYVEIYNNSDSNHVVTSIDGSAGYAVAASDGDVRFTIPNGTVLPARGHFLGANLLGYSLTSYPAGSGATATPDASYVVEIPDNAGIALFRSIIPGAFVMSNRLDAVGSTLEANPLYKEGTGYPPLSATNINCAFYRDLACGLPKDTSNNAADFVFVDPSATSAGAGQRLGAPGPENLGSPVQRNGQITMSLFDSSAPANGGLNLTRNFTPTNNAALGSYIFRRKFTNNTGSPIGRLRFRIVSLSTFPSPAGSADLRPRSSATTFFQVTSNLFTTLRGTTLETPPAQTNGGGLNSTFSVDSISAASPLGTNGTINVQFVLGVEQEGTIAFCVDAETTAGPSGNAAPAVLASLPPAFQMTGLHVTGPDVFVGFQSTSGAHFNLQVCTNLGTTNWSDRITNILAVGGEQWVTDPGAAAKPRGFYRLKLLP